MKAKMPANQFETSAHVANHHAAARRFQKVAKLVAELDRLIVRCELDPQTDWPIVVNVLKGWRDEHWASLAASVGKRPPSVVTRMLVIDALKARRVVG